MAVSISEKTFNFKDMGRQVVDWIDLFDECQYGAGKLFFRGRFETMSEVAEQIAASLSDDYKELGSGNPVAHDTETTFAEGNALHRYYMPDIRLWTPIDFHDPYPYKARYAVEFLLRLKLYGEYIYLRVGLPWEKLHNEDGSINEKYPIDPEYVSGGVSLEDIRPLEWWGASKHDINVIMGGMTYTDEEGNTHSAQPTEDGYEMPLEYKEIIEDMNVIGSNAGELGVTAFISQEDEDTFLIT